MADRKHELSDTSDDLLSALDDLRRLESEKRGLPISTPRFHELADRIAERSRSIFRIARREQGLGEAIETTPETIDGVNDDGADGVPRPSSPKD